MHRSVPAIQRDVAAVAVGYTYDATAPENPDLNRLVYANLPGARSMPLVGFVDPGLAWIHGFWGGRAAQALASEVAVARPFAPRVVTPTREVRVGPPADVPSATPYLDPGGAYVDAGGTYVDPGSAAWPPREVAAGPGTFPAPGSRDVTVTRPGEDPFLDAPPSGRLATGAFMPETPPTVLPPVARAPEADVGLELPAGLAADAGPWGSQALRTAYAQIQGKRYAAAQATLRSIADRLPDSATAREAAKGNVAIYNAKRMDQAASAPDREAVRVRAARDLQGSVWSGLFDA